MALADAITVGIEVDESVAALAATQHTAWMLVNLLARFEGIIIRVDVSCPAVPLMRRVVPGAGEGQDLVAAIVDRANAVRAVPIDVVPTIKPRTVDLHFIVGPGHAVAGAIRVYGDSWTGAISPSALPVGSGSDLPFGPYAAACLAAAHVFLTVRALSAPELRTVAYSMWSFTPVQAQYGDGPSDLPPLTIDAALAGVGAVGSTWLHAIWAVPSLRGSIILADSDSDGVTTTNLNRCPLFTRDSLGHPKAAVAASICANNEVDLVPHQARLQDLTARAPLVVSAVDRNTARAAIQALYPPRLFSASTSDLRAELLRCDPTDGAPCIRCYNPPEQETPDSELQRQFREASPEEQRAMAQTLDISLDDAMKWAVQGECGFAGDLLIAHLRTTAAGVNAFAVGFVSVLAGTMLAAQTVKELIGTTHPFIGVTCRAVLQFLNPSSDRNAPTPYAREEGCAMCDPDIPAGQIWTDRYAKGLDAG